MVWARTPPSSRAVAGGGLSLSRRYPPILGCHSRCGPHPFRVSAPPSSLAVVSSLTPQFQNCSDGLQMVPSLAAVLGLLTMAGLFPDSPRLLNSGLRVLGFLFIFLFKTIGVTLVTSLIEASGYNSIMHHLRTARWAHDPQSSPPAPPTTSPQCDLPRPLRPPPRGF